MDDPFFLGWIAILLAVLSVGIGAIIYLFQINKAQQRKEKSYE